MSDDLLHQRALLETELDLLVSLRNKVEEVVQLMQHGQHDAALEAANLLRDRLIMVENGVSKMVGDLDAELGDGS